MTNNYSIRSLALVLTTALVSPLLPGCGDDESSAVADTELAQQQIDAGAELFAEKCAACHGDSGEGTAGAPALVGMHAFPKDPPAGAFRDVQFVTALDVFSWAIVNMPANAPGTVSTDDMLKIFAFDLAANGVILDRPLDAELAEAIVLNP